MKQLPDELASIIENLERDHQLWGKIKSLNGAKFDLSCRCNSARLQRICIEQYSGPVDMESMKQSKTMPKEIERILEICRTNIGLQERVGAFSTSRFDLIFECGGFGLRRNEPRIKET